MQTVKIEMNTKPLSVNEAWQGKRFKTPKYKSYEAQLLLELPLIIMPKPPLKIYYEFGFSNSASDWDNPIKPLQDILQKKYDFDDNQITRAIVTKKKVKKGEEYFIVNIARDITEDLLKKARPKRAPQKLEIGGQTKTISQWCQEYKMKRSTVTNRVARGMNLKEAITTPLHHKT